MASTQYRVYIVTNKSNTTFYNGVTINLQERIWQHRHAMSLLRRAGLS
ncbi:GIY-YIG nuclease family protein [Mucilaginibacter sp.]